MTVPYLRGSSDAFTEPLAKIGEAVRGILQPYKDTEIALRGLIAENPELAQKLTDMEFKSPGSTASLFGPNAGKYFANLRPSNDAIIQKTITPYVERALKNPDVASYVGTKEVTGATPGGVEEDKYKGAIAQATLKAIQENPELMGGAVTRKATGGGVGKLAREAFEAKSLGTLNDILARDSPEIMIDKVLKNEYSPTELNAIFTAKSLTTALDMQLRARLAGQRDRLARELSAAKIANDKTKMTDLTTRLQVADALLQARTSGASTPAAFLALGGASQDLIEAFGGVTPDQLTEAQEAQDLVKRQASEKGAVSAYKTINSMMVTFQRMKAAEASPDELAAQVQAMQNTGNPYGYNVLYDEKNGLRVLDPSGQIVHPESEVTNVSKPTGARTTTPNLPPRPGKEVVRPTSMGGGSISGRSSIPVPIPREAAPAGAAPSAAPPQIRKMSNNSQLMLAQLEALRAGKDPRTRAKIEADFAEGLKKKAATNKEAKAIYDELKLYGHIK